MPALLRQQHVLQAVTPVPRASCTRTCTDRSPSLPEKRFVQAIFLHLPPYLEPLKKKSGNRWKQPGTFSEKTRAMYVQSVCFTSFSRLNYLQASLLVCGRDIFVLRTRGKSSPRQQHRSTDRVVGRFLLYPSWVLCGLCEVPPTKKQGKPPSC